MKEKVHKGSGNAFADLGLSNPRDRLAKAQLAQRICQIIADRGLTQARAAAVMGWTNPRFRP